MPTKRDLDKSKLKVLVVDNHIGTLDVVRFALNKIGIADVTLEQDPQVALGKLYIPFNLIVCERNMEPISGLDFLERIRAQEKDTKKTPFIMMSAADISFEDREEVRQAGANSYMKKGFTTPALDAEITKVCTAYEKLRRVARALLETAYDAGEPDAAADLEITLNKHNIPTNG